MKKGKQLRLLLTTIGISFVLAGCGSTKMNSMTSAESYSEMGSAQGASYVEDYNGMVEDSSYYGEDYSEGGLSSNQISMKENASSNRKLIKTVNLDVETQSFEELLAAVEERVYELNGYVESMESYNGSYYENRKGNRYSRLTLRIPKNEMNSFVNEISETSNIVRRNESVEDVTLSYVDIESHKKTLQVEEERLLSLLEKTEVLDNIISLEKRLSDIRYQIESTESQLRTYDNKSDYGTIYLNVDEVEIYTPVEEETVWERIQIGLTESMENIKDGFADFAVWFIINVPYLAIWIVVILVILLMIKGIRKRNKKRNVSEYDHLNEVLQKTE